VIIAVDFDGTIVHSKYPHIGRLKFGARRYLRKLWFKSFGDGDYRRRVERYTLILWTCRDGQDLENATEFLKKHGIYFHHVNENDPKRIELYGGDSRKISADLYIDDKSGWVCWPLIYLKIRWMEVRKWLSTGRSR
jgi:hypothetical protein